MMISPMKLVKKLAAASKSSNASSNRSSVAEKGHFVAYATDCERFVLPLAYLCNSIFQALLEVSEEEYGLPGNGPIMLPCDGACVEYLISLMDRSLSEDVQKALLVSLTTDRCLTSSLVQQELTQHMPVLYSSQVLSSYTHFTGRINELKNCSRRYISPVLYSGRGVIKRLKGQERGCSWIRGSQVSSLAASPAGQHIELSNLVRRSPPSGDAIPVVGYLIMDGIIRGRKLVKLENFIGAHINSVHIRTGGLT
ncbi:hypothetical protein H6P81_015519 [Aristolochia fimbriata]|uniref:Small auxin up regulated protein n=1 Tax=Aristolochia fimbriata TaxID=158543 RepID=A0AAV7E6G4_ARIFI|nr:hypothetical protein H6P81_015519 [Aristolochia fimbriata]